MVKFEVGQRVKIYPYAGNYGEIEAGATGIIVDVDERSVYPYKVFVEGREDTTTILLQEREMQFIPIAPAPDERAAGDDAIEYAYFLWKDTGMPASACDGEFVAQNRANPAMVEVSEDRYMALVYHGESGWLALRQQLAAATERAERAEIERARAIKMLNNAESVLSMIRTRLPNTNSYKDVNANRQELRQLAQDYFDTHPAIEAQADGKGE